MKAEQRDDGELVRNDRIFGVALATLEHQNLRSALGMDRKMRDRFEWFFEAYSKPSKQFRSLGWFGPATAWNLIESGRKRYRPPKAAPRPPSFAAYLEAAEG